MAETLRLILTKFTDETITIFSLLLFMTAIAIVVYWFYNRKKFHQLSHEIPASVVKNYLDSIIQNSNSLKSSLFRGGGLDIGNGIPSVVPVGDLPSSTSLTGSNREELSQKNAEIASLTQKLSDRQRQIIDLENTISEISSSKGGNAESDILRKDLNSERQKVRELEAKISATASGGGQLEGELKAVKAERDEIKERLKEYAIIEEDLANLKRLQQENEQLRQELAQLKKGAQAIPAAAPIAPAEPEEDLEQAMAQAIVDSKSKPSPAPAPEEVPVVEGEQKSAEELLSEFEKMLG